MNFGRAIQIGLLTLGFLFVAAGCQFAPVRYEREAEGQWQAKALVKDKKLGKSFIVNLDVNAIQNDKLRLDVTAALGHPVASVVMDGNNMTYVLMENKEFYKGAPTAQAMRSIVNIPLDPQMIFSMLFESPMKDKHWSCSKDKRDYLNECKDSSSGMSIRWAERKGGRKTVYVEHPQASLQLNFMSFKPKVEARAALFELNPPKSFKPIHL